MSFNGNVTTNVIEFLKLNLKRLDAFISCKYVFISVDYI